MREFETTFIVQPEISEEGCKALCDRLDGVFDRSGSVRLLYDDSGKRKLAYEIRKFQKGHYLTLMYLDEGKTVPEIERSSRTMAMMSTRFISGISVFMSCLR